MRRRYGPQPRLFTATVALALLPDIAPMLPVIAWGAFQSEGWALIWQFARATPGTEPAVPPLVHAASHHLHCFFHSALVAAMVTALAAVKGRAWLMPLAGWWLHIALDIPTHSRDYYPVPFLYPLTYWAFDGVDWRSGWVLALDYVALAAVYAGILRSRFSAPRDLTAGRLK